MVLDLSIPKSLLKKQSKAEGKNLLSLTEFTHMVLKKFIRTSASYVAFFLFLFPSFIFALEKQKTEDPSSPYEENYEEDSYDPFVDYSEFNQMEEEEEEDISFFLQGRFLSANFIVGYRFFTQTLGKITQPGLAYGLSLSYFFNLRFALKIGFLSGSNALSFLTSENTSVQGSFHMTDFNLSLKYYIDPQSLVRFFAVLNPYVLGGFSQLRRTTVLSQEEEGEAPFVPEDVLQFNFGGGLEIPLIRKKVFLGVEASYHIVDFPSEQSEIFVRGGEEATGIYPKGDVLSFLLNIGINF